MQLNVAYEFLPKRLSTNASMVMDHFGVGFETGTHTIADRLELPIEPGDVVCFTGASGSGKSSLMRAAAAALGNVLDVDTLDPGDDLLIDTLGLPVDEALPLLSSCGLGEARLMLRTPQELSDGQRYRFRLALGLAQQPGWIQADEFTATLDRTLARVIAFNIRRICDRTATGFLLATTHEDILDDLQPSLHVRCGIDGDVTLTRNRPQKKTSVFSTTSASPPRPAPTGRTSLAGIIAAITSESCGSPRCCGTATSPSASVCSHRRHSRCGSESGSSDSPAAGIAPR